MKVSGRRSGPSWGQTPEDSLLSPRELEAIKRKTKVFMMIKCQRRFSSDFWRYHFFFISVIHWNNLYQIIRYLFSRYFEKICLISNNHAYLIWGFRSNCMFAIKSQKVYNMFSTFYRLIWLPIYIDFGKFLANLLRIVFVLLFFPRIFP